MNRNYRKVLVVALALATGLSGCASTGEAPVEDRSLPSAYPPRSTPPAPAKSQAPVSGTYRVQRGDTLEQQIAKPPCVPQVMVGIDDAH